MKGLHTIQLFLEFLCEIPILHISFPLSLSVSSISVAHTNAMEITTFRIDAHRLGLVWFVAIQALSQLLGFSLVLVLVLSRVA